MTAAAPVLNQRKNTTCRQRKPACRPRKQQPVPVVHATTMQRIMIMVENRIGAIAQIASHPSRTAE